MFLREPVFSLFELVTGRSLRISAKKTVWPVRLLFAIGTCLRNHNFGQAKI